LSSRKDDDFLILTCYDNISKILAVDQTGISRTRMLPSIPIRRQCRHQWPILFVLLIITQDHKYKS